MSKIEEIKIITLGNSAVGKTSFIVQYTENKYYSEYMTTLGVDYKQKKIQLKNGKDIYLRIFDTAGQERFRSVSASFIKKADGIILIYDISSKDSFKSIGNWMEDIKDIGKDKIPVILVGNKCDLPDEKRVISQKEGEEKAEEFKIPFYETSCKDVINIKEVFEKLVEDISSKGNKNSAKEIKILKKGKNKKKCC